ncbi:MAG: hypothetical protein KKD63_13760 [Proteobacteria bacterium]|nr:hypothetical protein [Desulfobulbaceae bacterium]MBU4153934.1 hypothetical protein [Pseudomonadota bacterium]
MIRSALVVILLFLAMFMMRGVASDWRKGALESTDLLAKKAVLGSETVAPGVPAKPMQPTAPATLPDLKVGYVFNQERMLGGDEPLPDEKKEEDEGEYNENAQGITATIEEITFVGSIIADAFSRALILYPSQSLGGPATPASRSSRSKSPPPGAGAEEHAQLEVGDKISGYEVAEILPDKLIFAKGDETVEKLLFDPEKTRQAPPTRPGSGQLGGGPPRPPSPGGVLSTTIGGGGDPMNPAGVGGGSVPSPPPAAAPRAVPAMPPGAHSPTEAAPSSSPGSQPSAPVRRMVISRQSSPAPDTSKVMRQSRGSDEAVPQPPGVDMGPGGAVVELPPTPGMN